MITTLELICLLTLSYSVLNCDKICVFGINKRFITNAVLQMEKDVSVRQQAVDLLYAMCDKTNAEEIVQEMLNYLETADYSIREEMVIVSLSLLNNTWTGFIFSWWK